MSYFLALSSTTGWKSFTRHINVKCRQSSTSRVRFVKILTGHVSQSSRCMTKKLSVTHTFTSADFILQINLHSREHSKTHPSPILKCFEYLIEYFMNEMRARKIWLYIFFHTCFKIQICSNYFIERIKLIYYEKV